MRITRKIPGCKCVKMVNEKLAESNAIIETRMQINFKTGTVRDSPPLLMVTKISQAKRGRLPTLVCTFCPFCGRKFK